jgi:C_GCAxxG_C_C family probable redox protein
MDRVKKVSEVFAGGMGFNCCQAVLSTYGTQFGLYREIALKVSEAFGGGMGFMGETCGAVTGAFMVIGLKYGRTEVEDLPAMEKTHDLARNFVDRFKSRHRSIICKELLGCDISTPEGLRRAVEEKLIANLCPKFVEDAAGIIEQILVKAKE